MKIAFDARLLSAHASGVRDIAVGLVGGLRLLEAEGEVELTLVGTERSAGLDIVLPRKLFMHIGLPVAALRLRADRILVPRQTVPIFSAVPATPVFHDIGFLREREVYERNRIRDATTLRAARAKNVLAVSDFTATEMNLYGLAEGASGLPIQALHPISWQADAIDPYVLCVAVHEPHKNLMRLVRGWAKADLSGYRLVICGRRGAETDALNAAIIRLGLLNSVTLLGGLDDAQYLSLLAGCWAYIQPSIYEGLCIPALDLAAAGVPMAAGNLGNLGHVFSGTTGPLVFDPYSVEETAMVLRRICEDSVWRERAGKETREMIGLTDWRRVARQALGAMV